MLVETRLCTGKIATRLDYTRTFHAKEGVQLPESFMSSGVAPRITSGALGLCRAILAITLNEVRQAARPGFTKATVSA